MKNIKSAQVKKIDNVGRIQIPKYMKNNLKIKNAITLKYTKTAMKL